MQVFLGVCLNFRYYSIKNMKNDLTNGLCWIMISLKFSWVHNKTQYPQNRKNASRGFTLFGGSQESYNIEDVSILELGCFP